MTEPDFQESLRALFGSPLPPFQVEKLLGDASTRRYYRIAVEASDVRPRSVVVMQLPDDAFGSDEGGTQVKSDRLPFLEVGDLLRERGIRVPDVHVEALDRGQIILEDLGQMTFGDQLGGVARSDWSRPYAEAIDLLATMHERCGDLPSASIVARRRFDRELLTWELEHFREWGLEALFGPLDARSASGVTEAFSEIVEAMMAMPYGFVHRDFQSRNLMVSNEGAITVIDFQDALMGPRAYDLVALLCDSYVTLDADIQESMIRRYAAARRVDASAILEEFWLVTLHRKLKDAGRFVFIDRERNNAGFLQWYPQSLAYVGRALTRLERFAGLEGVLRSEIPGFPDSIEKPPSKVE
ncbi:MAG: phosphotransferase [Myxococcota bacterium]